MGPTLFLRRPLALILIVFMFLGMAPAFGAGQIPEAQQAFRSYLVGVAEPDLLLVAERATQLIDETKEQRKAEVAELLDKLIAAGLAGAYRFDESGDSFSAALGDTARDILAGSPLITSVEPQAETGQNTLALASDQVSIQGVSSVTFVQVNTPFVWGRVSVNGLNVQITLENSEGDTKGVPVQGTGIDSIHIDRTQLYYETVLTDPISREPVKALPGDRVRVITSGTDPVTGLPAIDERTIVVDNVQAWTSYERDTVSGIAPANSSVIVTNSSSFPTLSGYLTPGSSMTYTELIAGPDGTFSAASFRTSSDATHKVIDIKQGNSGFVRVRHPDGNEVYTVHGQNVLVLENGYSLHGYAFGLPAAPSSPPLESGVKVTRPTTDVTITLRDSQGSMKTSISPTGGLTPYFANLYPSMIAPGDTVEVSLRLNQAQTLQIGMAQVTAHVDIGANQITGIGPANTQLVLGAGLVNGYMTSSSHADYIENRVSTNSSGAYASGQFKCGTGNYLALQRGSFGYAGYEDVKGNFIYMAFAAPINYVMSDFPFMEGWIQDGTVRPSVTLHDSSGAIKQQATVMPLLLYMSKEKLYINTYYLLKTSQFIVPGDTVSVISGGQTHTIPVDRITAYVNTDTDTINGEAPAGAPARVVPAENRSSRHEVLADENGAYSAGNPFKSFANSNCTDTAKTMDFKPGNSGRVFVRHADGNEVFVSYGRSMHVQENDNYVEIYPFVQRDLDWWTTPARPVTLVLTPKGGSPITVSATSAKTDDGKTPIAITDIFGQKVLIRVGDSLSATFDEGPDGLTRPVTFSMNSLALVTGTPDIDTNTVAGVGPKGWGGLATLINPTNGKPAAIIPSPHTAYAPVSFTTTSNSIVTLVRGYSGQISFSDTAGHRLYTSWAVTAYQVKITGWLKVGDTQVCGKAPPGSTVRIHDVTTEGEDLIIGTGTADSQGNFCVAVHPPLYEGQVIMAEVDGTFSQPVIVRRIMRIFSPHLPRYP